MADVDMLCPLTDLLVADKKQGACVVLQKDRRADGQMELIEKHALENELLRRRRQGHVLCFGRRQRHGRLRFA